MEFCGGDVYPNEILSDLDRGLGMSGTSSLHR